MNEPWRERRIKKDVHGQPHRLRLMPAPGWDEVLVAEAEALLKSFSLPSKFQPLLVRRDEDIWFDDLDFRNLIEVPLRLLTAADVLWPLQSRHVGSFGELIQMYQNLPWELYLPAGSSIRLKTESFRSKLFHEGKIEELSGKEMRAKGFVLSDRPGAFRLYCEQIENRHTVYLSLGGDPLYQRRYKAQQQHGAPLQEHLAAAAITWSRLLQESDWQPDLLYIPFAGSGTLYFETLLQQSGMPPYRWRLPHYSVADLISLPRASWQQILRRLDERPRAPLPSALLVEKDEGLATALEASVQHFLKPLEAISGDQRPQILCSDMFQNSIPQTAERVWIPLNPPYGLRLEQGAGEGPQFYRLLAQWLLAQEVPDLRGFVLIPDAASLASFEAALPVDSIQGIHSFSQGGQHIRCVGFRFGAGASQ